MKNFKKVICYIAHIATSSLLITSTLSLIAAPALSNTVLQALKDKYASKQKAAPDAPQEMASAPAENQVQPAQTQPSSMTLKDAKTTIPIKPEHENSSTAVKGGQLWNFRQVDIRTIITEVARQTGKNFLIDPRVQGKATLISSKAMNPEALYQVFLSVLQVLGYTAVPSGQVIKIVPDAEAKTHGNQVSTNRNPLNYPPGDEIIVRIINTQHISTEQLLPMLKPLMTPSEHISVYPGANAIILSGRSSQIKRIEDIIQRVDISGNNEVDIYVLKYTQARDVVTTLQNLQINPDSPISPQKVAIVSDERANAILVSGNKNARARVRTLLGELDAKNTHHTSESHTQIIRLSYLKAKDIVPILAGVAQANFSGEVGTTIGTMSDFTRSEFARAGNAQGGNSLTGGAMYEAPAPIQEKAPQTNKSDGQGNKPKVEIIGEPNTNSIILNAPPTLMRILKGIIAKLDVRPAQVLVEALIAEIDEGDIDKLGIEWGSVSRNERSGPGESARNFHPGVAILNKQFSLQNFQVHINALAKNKKADILSTPSVIVLDNHQAKILVGKEVSIEDASYPGNPSGGGTLNPYKTFKRIDVALHLYVTPQLTHNNGVLLKIDQGNNTLQNPEDNSGRPVVNKSNINTSVIVGDGDILVLGGLAQNQLLNEYDKIPVLGDIPGVGQLFHNRRNNRAKKILVVFLRPTIIRQSTQSLAISKKRYEETRAEQLADFQGRPYDENYPRVILPNKQKVARLPSPFAGN